MPETRFLAQHTPHTTTLPRAQPFRGPGGGTTAGSHVSASPAAGAMGAAHVLAARQALSAVPGQAPRPAGTRPQDARVNVFPRHGAAGGPAAVVQVGAGSGGTLLATNQRPTVQLIERPRPAGAAQTQIPPGSGVPFELGELALVGNLLDQYVKGCLESGDQANAKLGGAALLRVADSYRILMGAQAQAQAQAQAAAEAQAQAQLQHMQQMQQQAYAPPAPAPTRVQVPSHPTSQPYQTHPHAPGGPMVIGAPPTVQVFPASPNATTQAPAWVPMPQAYPVYPPGMQPGAPVPTGYPMPWPTAGTMPYAPPVIDTTAQAAVPVPISAPAAPAASPAPTAPTVAPSADPIATPDHPGAA